MKQNGFTLVEMLVVIAILSVVGILILTIFTRSLKGTNKSQIISSIKQNGQSVLETMTSMVRNADDVVCPSEVFPSADTLLIASKGIYTRYRFTPEAGGKNGVIAQDNPVKQNVAGAIPAREETDAELVSRVCASNSSMSDEALILTDTHPQSGVSLKAGTFTKDKSAGFMDSIKITFKLDNPVNALPVLANEIDEVTFETTIQLR